MNREIKLTYSACRDMALVLLNQIQAGNAAVGAAGHADHRFEAVLCPLRGGFFLSNFLSRRLRLPVEFIHLSSYDGVRSSDFTVHFKPTLEAGKKYLICDDILATGRTIEMILALYPECRFEVAVLYRHKERAAGFPCHFARQIDSRVWVQFPWEAEDIEF